MEDVLGITMDTHGAVRILTLPPRVPYARQVMAGAGMCCVALGILVGVFVMWKAHWFGGAREYWYAVFLALGLLERAGTLLNAGRGEVRIRDMKLIARSRRRFGRSNVIPDIRKVRRLEIEEMEGWREFFFPGLTKLSAEFAGGQRTLIADLYPRAVLEGLAALLQPVLTAAKGAETPSLASELEVVDVSGIPPIARDVLEKPARCAIAESTEEGSTTFVLPRWGMFHSILRYVIFNVMAGIFGVLIAITILGILLEPPAKNVQGWAIALLVACLLLTIDLSLMVVAFHVFRRRTVLIVETTGPEAVLVVMSRGPCRARERVWRAGEIRSLSTLAISEGNSFTVALTEEGRASFCLRPFRGRRQVLADGPALEMRWLATTLRRLLGVGNVEPEPSLPHVEQSGAGRIGR